MANGNGDGFWKHPITVGLIVAITAAVLASIGGGFWGSQIALAKYEERFNTLKNAIDNVNERTRDNKQDLRDLTNRYNFDHKGYGK
jgi:hypothetical protein